MATRRGPYAKTRRHRRAIAEATLALVREKGHLNVTTSEIAERSGVAEATLLYNFPTKDHLFLEALAVSDEEETQRSTANMTGLDPTATIRLVATAAMADANRVRLFSVEAANAGDPDHPAHTWFATRGREMRKTFASTLRALQASGEAHPDVDPDRFALQFIAIWDGLQLQWLMNPTFNLADELVEALRTLTRADTMAARRAIGELARAI